jgi:histidinol-phosphate aminotransferase
MAKVRRPFDVTTTAQVAALASIGDAAEIERRRAINTEGRAALARVLRSHGLEPLEPAPGNFLYVDVGEDAAPLYERLLREGVIVRPLHGFGSPTAIRVSVGTPEENEIFGAALARALQRDATTV